jgi:hypothetical protein
LRRLLAVALAERPADRFQTGAAFVAALSAIARHERVPGPALPEPDNAESRPAPESVAVVVPVHAVADHDLIRPAGRAVSPAPAPHAGARARARRAPSVGALAAVGVVAVALGSGLAYRLAVRPRSAAVVSPAMPTMAPATAADIVLKREVPTPTVEAAVPDEGPASEVRPPVVADARVGVARANQLNITSEPSGALVTIDGRLSGATPTTVRSLSPGTYLVRVARPGHVPREERVTLASASVRTLAFALEPGLVPTTTSLGWVDVDSRPRGADVVIDGRAFGRTPLRVPSLTSGTHDLALKLGGYVSATRRLEIAAGRSTSLSVTLQSLER